MDKKMTPLSISKEGLEEKRRHNLFEDLIIKLKNIKNTLISCTRNGLIDIPDEHWNKINEKIKELDNFLDKLNKDKFKICEKK